MLKSVASYVIVGCLAVPTFGAEIWESTFDTTADGVVDLYDNNTEKIMIGANNGGSHTITTSDPLTNAYTPDKAGRSLDGAVSGSDSFSGLYRFSWTSLNEAEAQAYEMAGFLGSASPQTRQMMGVILRHSKVGSDYYVALDLGFGSVGISGFGYQGGSLVSLGAAPQGQSMNLAIGFDGGTSVLTAILTDAAGNVIASNSGAIDGDLIASLGSNELAAFAGTHLGWSDYSAGVNDTHTVWDVDSLTYYDTADEAGIAAQLPIPEPSGISLMLAGSALMLVRRKS